MRRYAFKLTLLYKLKKTQTRLGLSTFQIKYLLYSLLFYSLFYFRKSFIIIRDIETLFFFVLMAIKSYGTKWAYVWKLPDHLPIHSNWKDPKFPHSSYWKFLKILKNAYNFFIIRLNNILGWRATFANIKVKDQSHSKIILTSFVSLLLRVS